MTEETKAAAENLLVKLIEKTVNSMEVIEGAAMEAGVFVGEQIPLVIKELLTWKMVEAGVFMTFALAMILFPILVMSIGAKKYRKYINSDHHHAEYHRNNGWWNWLCDTEDGGIFYGVLSMFGFALYMGAIPTFCINLINFLQIVVAPRVYLIEYAASLVKNGG